MKHTSSLGRATAPGLEALCVLYHLPGTLKALVGTARARQRERRQLAALDERLLRDIGVTRLEAGREADKPFWSR